MWTGTEFEVDVYFIRHGKTKSNEEKRYLSYTDEPLSEIGRDEIIGRLKSYPEVERVFTSTLSRTIETAAIIYKDIRPVQIAELDEINFGDFEGKTYEQLKNNDDYIAWLDSNCRDKIKNGESLESFIDRQLVGLKKALKEAEMSKSIAIVAHGGTIMSIFSRLLGEDYYSFLTVNGDFKGCHIKYNISELGDVFISHFSPVDGDNT